MQPLISCLCPTRNKPEMVSVAVDCFNNQTYPNKELILVSNEFNPYIEDIKKFTNKNIKLFYAPENTALGAIRNISVDNANGEYIAQWDDDNIHHENRLQIQYQSLKQSNKQACFLKRVLINDMVSKKKGISKVGRGVESTILVLKKSLPRYDDNIKVGEDVFARHFFQSNGRSVVIDEPRLYVYNIHDNNTCQYIHLKSMMDTVV